MDAPCFSPGNASASRSVVVSMSSSRPLCGRALGTTPDRPVAVAGSPLPSAQSAGASLPACRLVPSACWCAAATSIADRGRSRPGLSPVQWESERPAADARQSGFPSNGALRLKRNVFALSRTPFASSRQPIRLTAALAASVCSQPALSDRRTVPCRVADYLLVIRCRVCRDCLDRPELRDASDSGTRAPHS